MSETRANSGLDLHLDFAAGGRPRVREALERALREAVAAGRLVPGAALPPSRSLASDLGIARNTVTEVYTQLVAEGWLVAQQGAATRVASRPATVRTPGDDLSVRTSPCRYDLRAGFPDVSSFPRSEWLSSARAALSDAPAAAFGYGPLAGLPVLRAALAAYLGRARGADVDLERVVVCAGFTAGLRLVAAALRTRGVRRIGVEQYGHASHRAVLADAGLTVTPLAVDEHGAVPDGLDGLGAVLLTPAHQFPLGVALAPQRRASFTSWAARTGAVIVEDDYDGEFRYDRRALGAVQALAPDHVVYAGTASKTLAPGLRLGWLVAPDDLRATILERQFVDHSQPAAIEQLTLAKFLDSGRYDRHVRRSRSAYRQRRDRLVRGLARRVPELGLTGMNAGLHALLPLPDGLPESVVVDRARERDLAVEGLSSFTSDGEPERRGLVIGYATPAPHAYTSSLARLFAALTGT